LYSLINKFAYRKKKVLIVIFLYDTIKVGSGSSKFTLKCKMEILTINKKIKIINVP
jgi:hypothetical protein